MNSIVKVLLVSPLPPPAGGIANWSLSILQEVQARRDVEIVHVDTAVRWRSVTDQGVPKRLIGGSMQAMRDIFRVISSVRRFRPEVVHLCASEALSAPRDILILIIAKFYRAHSIVHYRMGRLPAIIAGNTWEWKMIRIALKIADTVLLLDNMSADSVRGAFPNLSVQQIPNPINMNMVREVLSKSEKKTRSEGVLRIAYVGWVVPWKGIRELVKACLLVEDVQIALDLVGEVDDNFRRELESLAARRPGGEWVRFRGNLERQEAMGCVRDADMFVLPSHTEGFPNVVLEAMALGKPIVSTRVGAIAEMLDENSDEPCGIVVKEKDVSALNAAILDLYRHPEIAKAYGDRARKKALSAYSMDRVMEQYVSLWFSLANY